MLVKVLLELFSFDYNTVYNLVQSLMSIGSGGLTGLPWGQGSGKFFYLPEAHTDFAFAIFCQEWGLLGAAILISVFLLLAAAFFRIAMNTKDERGFILVSGVSLLIVGQAVANMAMVCGLLPVIGVPLSFISYGGTSMLITLASIGLVLSVYRDECKREKLERLSPDTRRTQMRVVSPAEGRWQR
ncbi:FtsW/RodA/SpoVE family cell cycle protein, partial [Phascolarctobacterium faecium]